MDRVAHLKQPLVHLRNRPAQVRKPGYQVRNAVRNMTKLVLHLRKPLQIVLFRQFHCPPDLLWDSKRSQNLTGTRIYSASWRLCVKIRPLKPKTFMLIAGALAAEQRPAVAHSASYGFNRPRTHQAPAGARENHHSTTHFVRPVRGLNRFANTFPRFHRGLLPRATPWLKQRQLVFHCSPRLRIFALK